MNGTSVTLASGTNAFIIVEFADPDGDDVKVLKAPGPQYNTDCLNISGNTVNIDTSNLTGCDIA